MTRKVSLMLDSTNARTDGPVAALTVDAVHRRDHHHVGEEACHPHRVEVVHLGHRAIAVCHDCGQDSGFVPEREADQLATEHRTETAAADRSRFMPHVA